MKGRQGKNRRRERAIERHEKWIESIKRWPASKISDDDRRNAISMFEEIISNTKKKLGRY